MSKDAFYTASEANNVILSFEKHLRYPMYQQYQM